MEHEGGKMLETRIDVRKTAVLVIDVQNDLVKAREEPFKSVAQMVESKKMVSNIAKLISAARKAGMPVVYSGHVRRVDSTDVIPTITDLMIKGILPPWLLPPPTVPMIEGTTGARIVSELQPAPGDHVIWKRRSNAFYNTDLESMLRAWGIDTVIITGLVTNRCVANTARGARERDFHFIILSDCVACGTTEDDEYFLKRDFPLEGRVRTSAGIIQTIAQASR
jgi:ureidoacrylate peracid hydrolase